MSLAHIMLFIMVVVCILSTSVWGSKERNFPPGFKFGAASSSYQIEGAWNVDEKSESIWDVFTHTYPEKIVDYSNGDVACDSYNQWERDIEIIEELGLDFYRFSLSWPRLLPTSFPNKISEAGTKYYNNLINGLLAKGIEPVVTIFHWDLPERLQKLGGWMNPLTTDWFADYARVVYTLFGDRVKTWITINEPILICDVTWNSGQLAPGVRDPAVTYICSKNILIAHAKAYRIYDQDYRPKYQGEVGITNQLFWMEADSEEHEELAELVRELSVSFIYYSSLKTGLYSHPIFSKDGGWPPSIEKHIAEKSKEEGYTRSRLPAFTKEEKDLVRGSSDFFGFNFYTSRIVRKAKPEEILDNWPMSDAPELNARIFIKPEWPVDGTYWFAVYPEGIRYMLAWVRKKYGNPKIFIVENGYPSKSKSLEDVERVQYYKDNLEQVLLAMNEDGVNVTGYTAWTLMDNFEWGDGYSANFGLYNVDFNDPKRPRTARASARYYASVIKHRSLDPPLPICVEL